MLRKRFLMPKFVDRNPELAPGDWYIDTHCIDCAASREVAPVLAIHRHGKAVFGRQPANEEEEFAAWRAVSRPHAFGNACWQSPFPDTPAAASSSCSTRSTCSPAIRWLGVKRAPESAGVP